jgi:hypothetical protein
MQLHVWTYVCIYVRMYIYIYVCVCVYVYIYIYVCVCVYVCMHCVCIYVYLYVQYFRTEDTIAGRPLADLYWPLKQFTLTQNKIPALSFSLGPRSSCWLSCHAVACTRTVRIINKPRTHQNAVCSTATRSTGKVSTLRPDRFTSGEPLTGRLFVPQCRRKDKSLPALRIWTLAPRMSSSIAVITAYLVLLCSVHRLPCDVRRSSIRNRFVCPAVIFPSLGISVIFLLFSRQVQTKGRGVRAPFCGLVPVRLTAVVAKATVWRTDFGLACIHVVPLKAQLKHLRKPNTNKETCNVCVGKVNMETN